jgi:DNA-3-methyladenine glycosylase I
MQAYHDDEWGVPVHDDRRLFEFLVLEGAQAGLSWSTILRKRPAYRAAFHGFEIAAVARFGGADVGRLLADAGIVRNRAKIGSAVRNADLVLAVVDEFGSLDAFLWQFVGGRTVQNRWRSLRQVPPRTAESDAMSQALRRRGFGFVGSGHSGRSTFSIEGSTARSSASQSCAYRTRSSGSISRGHRASHTGTS